MAKPLALTTGEPAGIGLDITIEAWLRRKELELPAFYLLGDRDSVSTRAKTLGLKLELAEVSAGEAAGACPFDCTPFSISSLVSKPLS